MNIAEFFQKNRMMAKVEKVQLSKQRHLYLEDFDLTEFPDVILNCDSIRSLILQRNKISKLPRDIGIHLRGLKYLSIQFNSFQSFPECLKHLTILVSLNISHNPIKNLPDDIDCLKDLKYLWCNSCGINSLPKCLGNLSRLETFGARNNEIELLPETIVNLKELKWLSMEGNKLNSLPHLFFKLKNLHHLNLNNNCFTEIPAVLPSLSSLMYVHMQRNSIKTLYKDMIVALAHVKISLLHNPIENVVDFKAYRHLMINPLSPLPLDSSDGLDLTTESSEWDSDWEHSTDTCYLNYDSSSESTESDGEFTSIVPKLSKYFVGQ